MHDVASPEERSGEQERIVTTQGTFPQETPPSLLSPSAYVGGLPFPSPTLRNDQLLLFFIVVFGFVFAVVQTRHFF